MRDPDSADSSTTLRRGALAAVGDRLPFRDVPGPFQQFDAIPADENLTPSQVRGMRAFWWDGFWANVPETVLVSYLGLYILAFGGSSRQVGLVTAFGSLFAALAFFPGARAVETIGHRKTLVLVSGGGIGRVALLGLAFIPFFADGDAAIWMVLVFISLRGLFGYFASPGWTSLVADVVPIDIRGRFMASRNFGMSIASLATAPLVGLILDRVTGLGGWQIVWIVASAAAFISTWCFAQIPDPAPHADVIARRATAQRSMLSEIFSDPPFVMYLAASAAWNVSLHAAGPFFNVYLAEKLDASALWIGVLSAIPAVTGLGGLIYFGRVMDQRGTRWVLILTGLLIPILPAAWLAVTAPWQVIFINVFGGVIWAGYQLAALNMLMAMSPLERRARYSAAFHAVIFAAAFVGPLIGGEMIDSIGFKALFVFSAAGRIAGTLIMARFIPKDAETAASP